MDKLFEPFMEKTDGEGILPWLFGEGKGSGATFLLFCIGIAGVAVCIIFWSVLRKYRWNDEIPVC